MNTRNKDSWFMTMTLIIIISVMVLVWLSSGLIKSVNFNYPEKRTVNYIPVLSPGPGPTKEVK